jgi:hypothetical protein
VIAVLKEAAEHYKVDTDVNSTKGKTGVRRERKGENVRRSVTT